MMIKRWWWLLLVLIGIGIAPQPVQAADSPQVLLAYDSQDVPEGKPFRISQMQQLLTSAGLRVHMQNIAEYQRGQIQKNRYAGVVTMVTWDDAQLRNPAFTADRAAFTGTKLHVGGNLQPDELASLQSQAQPLYRRQLVASWPDQAGAQLLPYTTPVWVLQKTPANAVNIGQLAIQGSAQHYPYATIVDQSGYLPYFDGVGQSELAGAEVVARLFKAQPATAPLFTLTEVTPYTDLKRLRAVGRYLADQQIPFAVSATSVARNTELAAYGRYTAVLRELMAEGGVVFLQTPIVGNGLVETQTLANDMISTVTALAQRNVFPIGISFPTYWNQDHLYRQQALSGMDAAIQLPNPSRTPYAEQDDQLQTFKTAFASMPASTLTTQRYGTALASKQLNVKLPLAVTFAMPDSQKQWVDFKRQVQKFSGSWFEPQTLTTSYRLGMVTLGYRQGIYYVNGRQATGSYHTPAALKLEKKPQTWMNKFFAGQSKLMWLFFGITFSTMAVMLILGRRVYLQMYRRKPAERRHHDDS